MITLSKFWPRAEVIRLRRENETLSRALQAATKRAAHLQDIVNESVGKPCPSCEILKQTVNFHVRVQGFKIPMFDGVGPTPPPPVEYPKVPIVQNGPQRASMVARSANAEFTRSFMQQQLDELRRASEVPSDDYTPPIAPEEQAV